MCFVKCWPPDEKSLLIGKDTDAGKDGRQKENVAAEGEMVSSISDFSGHKFEQIPGDTGG